MSHQCKKQYRRCTLPGGKVIVFDRSIPGWIASQSGYPNRYGIPEKPKMRMRHVFAGGEA